MLSIQNAGLHWSRKAGLGAAMAIGGIAAIRARGKKLPPPPATGKAPVSRAKETEETISKWAFVRWIKDESNNALIKALGWFVAVVLSVILTFLLLFLSSLTTSNYTWAVFGATILWALLFGAGLLFFLPSKAVTTIFGTMLGMGIGDVQSDGSLLVGIIRAVKSISDQIGVVIGVSGRDIESLITQLVFTFVFIVSVSCLPAFFKN